MPKNPTKKYERELQKYVMYTLKKTLQKKKIEWIIHSIYGVKRFHSNYFLSLFYPF